MLCASVNVKSICMTRLLPLAVCVAGNLHNGVLIGHEERYSVQCPVFDGRINV